MPLLRLSLSAAKGMPSSDFWSWSILLSLDFACRLSLYKLFSSFERFERDDFTSVNGIGCVARQVVAREKDRDERKARIDFVNATNLVSIGLVGESSWAVRFFCASSFTQANLSGSSAALRVNRVCLAWSRSFEF